MKWGNCSSGQIRDVFQTQCKTISSSLDASRKSYSLGAFVWKRQDLQSGGPRYSTSSGRAQSYQPSAWHFLAPVLPLPFAAILCLRTEWEEASSNKGVGGWELELLKAAEIRPRILRGSPDPWQDPKWLRKADLLSLWLIFANFSALAMGLCGPWDALKMKQCRQEQWLVSSFTFPLAYQWCDLGQDSLVSESHV